MTTKELINLTIEEIRICIKPYSYDGSIPLELVEVEIKLSNKWIIDFPFHPDSKLETKSKFTPNFKTIYPQATLNRLFNRKEIWNKIKGQKIVGIWEIGDDFGEEICGIELSNGNFLVKGQMSPIGTGNADLFIFKKIETLKIKYESGIQKIHGA